MYKWMNVIIKLHQIHGGCVGRNGEIPSHIAQLWVPYCARSLDRLPSILLFDVVEEDKVEGDRLSYDEESDEATGSQKQMVQYKVKRTPLLNYMQCTIVRSAAAIMHGR